MKNNVFFGLLVMIVAVGIIGCGGDENETTTYTVTFNSNGGTILQPISGITFGSTINKPNDPIKGDDTFLGWFKEIGLINKWNFSSDIVTSKITLYAKWTNGNGGADPLAGTWIGTAEGYQIKMVFADGNHSVSADDREYIHGTYTISESSVTVNHIYWNTWMFGGMDEWVIYDSLSNEIKALIGPESNTVAIPDNTIVFNGIIYTKE